MHPTEDFTEEDRSRLSIHVYVCILTRKWKVPHIEKRCDLDRLKNAEEAAA